VTHGLSRFLEPTTYGGVPMLDPSTGRDWTSTVVANAAGLIGLGVAYALYARGRTAAVSVPGLLVDVAARRFYWDDVYRVVFYLPSAALARLLQRVIERPLFDAPLDGTGAASQALSRGLGAVQNGIVRAYALVFAFGVGGLVLYFMLRAS
jgi:NADH-quinone oxidoreductase subunit L